MKVLIAGANGKIGRRLIPHLVADNIQVRAMVRDISQKADLEMLGAHEVVEADRLAPLDRTPEQIGERPAHRVGVGFSPL